MKTGFRLSALGACLSALSMIAAAAHAQTLPDRVASSSGTVAFQYATKPYVCGDGRGIFISDDSTPGWNSGRHRSGTAIHYDAGDNDAQCETGPARVLIRHDGKQVTSLRLSVGRVVSRADTELGMVSPEEAARYLLAIAPELDGRAGDEAVTAAAVAPFKSWPRMLEIARDNAASESSRKSAMFWLSQEATAAAVAGLGAVAEDDDANAGVRSDALFYLAQHTDGAGVEALIRVVRKSKSRKIRKDALWFLSQSRDPRAMDLFAELLSGR